MVGIIKCVIMHHLMFDSVQASDWRAKRSRVKKIEGETILKFPVLVLFCGSVVFTCRRSRNQTVDVSCGLAREH